MGVRQVSGILLICAGLVVFPAWAQRKTAAVGAAVATTVAPVPDSLLEGVRTASTPEERALALLDLLKILADTRRPVTEIYAPQAVAAFQQLGDSLRVGIALDYWAGYRIDSEEPRLAVGLLARATPLLATAPDSVRAQHLYWQGLGYTGTGRRAPALRAFREGLRLAQGNLHVDMLNGLGSYYVAQGQHDSASLTLFTALRAQEKRGAAAKVTTTAGILANLATTYYLLERSAEALPLAQRAVNLLRTTPDSAAVADGLILLGELTRDLNHPQQALPYLRAAHRIRVRRGLESELGQSCQFLAAAFEQLGQTDSAIGYYQRAIRLQKRLDQSDAGNSMRLLADVYLTQGRLAEAELWARRALAEAPDNPQAILYVAPCWRILGAVAEQRGNYRQALVLFRRQRQAEDAHKTRENARLVEELRVTYATEQAEQAAQLANLRATTERARASRLSWTAAALALGLAAVGALAVLLQRQRRRLTASEAALRQVDATKDRLLSIIGHDLRGPVANFQQAMPLVRFYADHPDPTELAALADDLGQRAHQLGALLDNLLFWSRTQRKEVRNHPESVTIADLLAAVAALYQPLADAKHLTLRVDDPTLPLPVGWADPALLSTVLRNLVSNAIKFTPAGGQVTMHVRPAEGGQLTLAVSDNGVGMTAPQVALVFAVDAGRSTAGTAGEGGTGLGLLVCQHFVQLLGSELAVTSTPGVGSEFSFRIPVGETSRVATARAAA